GDGVFEETIAKDVSEIVAEKTKKKRKSKAIGDASVSAHPPKRLREDLHVATFDVSRKSLAALRGLIPEDSFVFELNLQMRPLVASAAIATATIVVDVSAVPPPHVKVISRSHASVGRTKKNVTSTSKLDEPTTSSAEAILLHEQVFVVEAADVEETKVVSLTAQVAQLTFDLSGSQFSCNELTSKVVSLESEKGGLVNQISSLESAFELFKQQIEAMQDEQATALHNWVMKLEAQLLDMAAHLEEEFYPRYLTTISGWRWILTHGLKLDGLKAGVDHGKAGRDLSVIKAYDPSAKSKYIDVVNALGAVDFSLLTELESKNDASMVDLMDSLGLEGPLAEILGEGDLQPSPKQLMLPIHRTEDNILLGETSLSFSLQVVHSRVQRVSTFVAPATADLINTLSMTFSPSGVVPPLSIPDYQVLDTEPHDGDPSSIA
nr:hypothetical protein [Tanacetum cinerariifolium]